MSGRLRGLAVNAAILVASGTLALAGSEVGLRLVIPPARGYFVRLPGERIRTQVQPGLLPGVVGPARYTVNRFGIRGRGFGLDLAEYRILAVGGSATECLVLDDTVAWSYRLEIDLPNTTDGRRPWVGNVGRSGHTAREHAVQLKYLLPQFPRIDVVVALVGANDMAAALAQGWGYRRPPPITDPAAERERLTRAFVSLPGRLDTLTGGAPRTWYRTTALWQLARRARSSYWARRDVRPGEDLRRLRAHRAASPHLDSLPPLDLPLGEYRTNLEAMVAATRSAGARLVLVTQPAMWSDHLGQDAERLLWFGWIGGRADSAKAYYMSGVLASAMDAYNAALLEVCRAAGVECVDAAATLPKDTSVFYDDLHFNVAGSYALAGVLHAYLASHPPFVGDDGSTSRP
ncbi:MAG TPA: GDSL-type esterase/lipase family protein [Gemmatimonadales bacterium]